MHITYISSFVPRKCGIATYTRDLALETQNQGCKISVVAMENRAMPIFYSQPVAEIIRQELSIDYKKVAQHLNSSSTDIIHLQHEFGLFGGEYGEYILEFATRLTKPLVVTFHTVLLTPTNRQKHIIQALARLSRRVTVMDEIAKDRLVNVYGLNSKDIAVIFHGAPTVTLKQVEAKKSIHYPTDFILLANNLLSRNKGIEYAIEAVAQSILKIPNLVFLVVGETHPLVKISEGESYREELTQLVKKLHLEKHVIFRNQYLPLEELKILLAAADVYLTPFLDPQQITSGTLTYALGANIACISTEYIYAKEMLAAGRGILVPFRNADAIAAAIVDLYKHPEKRHAIERKAQTLRNNMSWPKVAHNHIKFYEQILRQEHDISYAAQQFIHKPLDISYLSHLTDTVGIMQHAYHTIPDRKFGYSTDDNARALIVVSQLSKKQKNEHILHLIKIYISFLQFAQEPDGKIHTFLNFHRNWDDNADVTDAYGKMMWALGFYLYTNVNAYFIQPIHTLFSTSLEHVNSIHDLRNAAYTVLGLYYYILAYDSKTDTALQAVTYIKKLADFLMERHKHISQANWNWFETEITYDNFRLPQALFAAYMVTHNTQYKEAASSTLEFITNCNFDKQKKYFDFIGQNGWYKKGKKKEEYDQQPLEAAGAVESFLFAAKILKKKSYINKAFLAFEWFFGKNRNHRYIYDIRTKGVHDGLNLRGVNQNEGAESLVCFLMATLSLKNHHQRRSSTNLFSTVASPIA